MSIRSKTSEVMTGYPVNHDILRGLSEYKMKEATKYLESQFRENIKKEDGLKFIKLEIIDPIKAARTITSKSSHTYDISRTEFAMAEMHYEYKGTPLPPLPLYVPVKGPIMDIAGSPYILRMVLSDKLLSPGQQDIFMRVYRGKARITRDNRNTFKATMILDGRQVTMKCSADVLVGNFFTPNIPANMKITKSEPSLLLYLLARFDYKETMMRLLGYVPEIITLNPDEDVSVQDEVIFSTALGGEQGFKIRKSIIGKDLENKVTEVGFRLDGKLFHSLSSSDTATLNNVMASLFYILDGMPDIEAHYMSMPEYWVIPFRDTLYGKGDDRKKELQATSHLEGLGNYLTAIVIEDIKNEFGDTLNQDFTDDGFFKLLIVLIHKFHVWRNASSLISASVTDKRLRLYYYMFVDIITQMNIVNMLVNNPKTRPLDQAGVLKLIRTELNIGRMYRIKGGAGKQGAMKPNQAVKPLASYSGDHKYIKITSDVDVQINVVAAMSSKKRGASNEGDPTTLLDPGQCVAGTMNCITKSRLAATRYINCFAPYDPETGTIRYDDEIREDLKEITDIISRTSHRPKNISIPPEFDIYGDINPKQTK